MKLTDVSADNSYIPDWCSRLHAYTFNNINRMIERGIMYAGNRKLEGNSFCFIKSIDEWERYSGEKMKTGEDDEKYITYKFEAPIKREQEISAYKHLSENPNFSLFGNTLYNCETIYICSTDDLEKINFKQFDAEKIIRFDPKTERYILSICMKITDGTFDADDFELMFNDIVIGIFDVMVSYIDIDR